MFRILIPRTMALPYAICLLDWKGRRLKSTRWLALLVVAFLSASSAEAVINTVPVGNPGNAGDVQSQGSFGAVGYNYRIGKTEVTNAQYVAFLNAVATTDPLGLYNPSMGDNIRGGIAQGGANGSFTYAARTNMGDKPVNFVSWYDAIRFANWLHNNQPTGPQGPGTTETGAYTLLGGTPTPSNGLIVARNSGADWVLPSENEWYKAAYYYPTTASYFTYATSSDSEPTRATADASGNISNPGANVANYNFRADWNGQDGNVTTVGSAGASSASPYFTFDQHGNVAEWNETLSPFSRVIRGGSWASPSGTSRASFRSSHSPTVENEAFGFRVATIPEPSTLLLAALAAVGLMCRRPQRSMAPWAVRIN